MENKKGNWLEEVVKRNPVIYFLTKAVGFILCGWYGHIYFLDISHQVVIDTSELEKLKIESTLGKEKIINKNRLLESLISQQQKELAKYSELVDKTEPSFDTSLVKISNIKIFPTNKRELKINENVEITLDYEFEDGISGNIWAIGSPESTYSPSRQYSEKGTLKRYISLDKHGKINEIELLVKSTNGVIYKKIILPVNYLFN